jgi:hypothetical protein
MKFKSIFIVFNIIIVFSFLFIFFMPLALLGWDYTSVFWGKNWPLALVFVAIIGALNVFFALNWKIFSMLEREEWTQLASFLEERVYRKKSFRSQYVRILVNTYMVSSNVGGIERLEEAVRRDKPALLERNALLFGIPYVLKNDGAKMESFFAPFLPSKKVESRDWIAWDYSFALLVQKKPGEAAARLRELVRTSRDACIKLLSLYLIATTEGGKPADGTSDPVTTGVREYLKTKFPRDKLAKEIERAKGEVYVVILSRLLDDALDWLYPPEGETGARASR